MKNYFLFFSIILLSTACRQTYYIVRHAEKAVVGENNSMISKDPSLAKAGNERAEALKKVLKTKKIGYIFSTNTNRTRSTAEPVKIYFNLVTKTYPPVPDTAFINLLKTLKKTRW